MKILNSKLISDRLRDLKLVDADVAVALGTTRAFAHRLRREDTHQHIELHTVVELASLISVPVVDLFLDAPTPSAAQGAPADDDEHAGRLLQILLHVGRPLPTQVELRQVLGRSAEELRGDIDRASLTVAPLGIHIERAARSTVVLRYNDAFAMHAIADLALLGSHRRGLDPKCASILYELHQGKTLTAPDKAFRKQSAEKPSFGKLYNYGAIEGPGIKVALTDTTRRDLSPEMD